MVMSETRETSRNGKRSRGSSPSTNNNNTSSKPPPVTSAGDLTPETSDDDTHSKKNLGKSKNGKSEFEEKIRVGKDYQVIVPEMQAQRQETYADKALLVWSPARDITDSRLEEYITMAKESYGYNAEQALGMLFWHKHDLEKAVTDLANFTPFPDEWTKEDKVLFEQAFQFHGKCFHRIRQMLPDKTIASLVKFYYSWKKTRSRTSVMDRQEKKKTEGGSENGSENGSPEDSDVEDKKWPIRGIRRTSRSPSRLQSSIADTAPPPTQSSALKSQDAKRFGSSVSGKAGAENNKDTGYSSSSSSSNGASKLSSLNCQNCTVLCNELKASPIGRFCLSCFNHWRRTGILRPTQGPQNIPLTSQRPRSKTNKLYYYQGYHDGSSKHKRQPPKGMFINHDDVLKLAAQDLNVTDSLPKEPASRSNDLLVELDREIGVLYSQIQTNKQKISSLKDSNEQGRDGRLPEEVSLNRVNVKWTKDEFALAMMGFRKFGQNFKAIAELLGTKTESHVRKFFVKYRKSRDLDSVCRESQKGNEGAKQSIEIMEIESDDDVQQVKDAEMIGNIDEIIGVNGSAKNDNEEANKSHGKTSIMTTSTGKTLKRKHDDAIKIDDEVVVVEVPEKKLATEQLLAGKESEITLTPIPKVSDDKTNGKAVEAQVV